MKAWHIQTWGAGTPHYLVSAETKEQAWAMVKEEWKKKYKTKVGYQDLGVRGGGELVGAWDSVALASRSIGIHSITGIYNCLSGRAKSSGGYIWKKS